jgi:hypothetical protein
MKCGAIDQLGKRDATSALGYKPFSAHWCRSLLEKLKVRRPVKFSASIEPQSSSPFSLNPILSQLNPFNNFTIYVSKIRFNIIVPSTPRFPICSACPFHLVMGSNYDANSQSLAWFYSA